MPDELASTPVSSSPPPPWRRWAAVAAGTFIVLLALRLGLRLSSPLGPDPAMWGLSASQVLEGVLPRTAVVYPAVTALLSVLVGMEPWYVGGWVSLFVGATIPVFTLVLARQLELPTPAAALAALASLAAPDVLGFCFQLQPDALATVGLLLVAIAGLHYEAHPERRTLLLWVGSALLLCVIREHGPLVLVILLATLLARRWPALAVGLLLATALGATAFILSGAVDWLPARVALPLRESPLGAGSPELPSYANELGGPLGERFESAWRSGSVFGVWLAVLERLVARSGENLTWIALGAAGFAAWFRARGRGVGGLVALSPTLFLLVIWSHRRHTSVLLPIAAVGIAAGLTLLVRRWPKTRWPALIAAVAGIGALASSTPRAMIAMRGAAESSRENQVIASWMAEQPGLWFLGGMHNEVNLFLMWPRHNPQLPPPGTPMPEVWSGTDWRTMWVGPVGSMPPPYSQVHTEGHLAVFRLEAPEGTARPCAEVRPADRLLFTNRHHDATSAPPCRAAPEFREPPKPTHGPWEGQPFRPPEGPH